MKAIRWLFLGWWAVPLLLVVTVLVGVLGLPWDGAEYEHTRTSKMFDAVVDWLFAAVDWFLD